jgi:hypothetical protein
MKRPHELTENQVRKLFLEHIWSLVVYWDELQEPERSQR